MTDTFENNCTHWYPIGKLPEPFFPVVVDRVRNVFPAEIEDLLPPQTRIPDGFKSRSTDWDSIASAWFHKGLPDDVEFYGQEGIDPAIAYRHLDTIIRSYQPKHEYKMAAIAYLMSLWFTEVRRPGGE